mgnify:FL=1
MNVYKELIKKEKIYNYTNITISYNSSKIEKNSLSIEETKEIYYTPFLTTTTNKVINLDDLIEMKNHFKLFDYCLSIVDAPLTKEIIIEMNKILKRNTSDEDNPRYNVGGFKTIPNVIGIINVIHTSSPEDVEKDLDNLLKSYHNKQTITLEDIIDFHYNFEKIHPFGDGNGRVGRMIMFKECLKNNIMPFIVLDKDKPYYMRGLKNYNEDKMFLIDTIKYEQDLYKKIVTEMIN